jgi:hypothetical protein
MKKLAMGLTAFALVGLAFAASAAAFATMVREPSRIKAGSSSTLMIDLARSTVLGMAGPLAQRRQ